MSYAVRNDGKGWRAVSDASDCTEDEFFSLTQPQRAEPSLEELKGIQSENINIAFEKAIQEVTSGYPTSEVKSWSKQETEARAYLANNNADTPLINALASSRSVDKADLVERIIAKADLFADISGTLIGRRQALEHALDALPETATAEDVAGIGW